MNSLFHPQRTLPRLAALLFLGAAVTQAAEPVREPTPFESNLKRVFERDQIADIRVTFGYDNWMDYKDPNDPGRARNFMVYLASHGFVQVPCTEAMSRDYGVAQDTQNLRIFEGRGQPGQLLRVAMIWSAATSSTAKNIGGGYARQLRCSEQSLKFMQKSCSDAGVMVYVGHSRGGGGPDTFPPQTIPGAPGDRQKVDFSYYRRTRPGLASLSQAFSSTKDTPHIIIWTGCKSDDFRGWLADRLASRAEPASAILSNRLTRQMPWKDEIEGCDEGLMVVLRLIETLQQPVSQAEFEKRLKASEIEEMREPERAEWRLVALPSPKSAKTIANNSSK